jgi:hypothetical protein
MPLSDMDETYGSLLIGGKSAILHARRYPHNLHSLIRDFVRVLPLNNFRVFMCYMPISLQGMLTVQAYIYYETFPADSKKLKSLVGCSHSMPTPTLTRSLRLRSYGEK